MRSFTVLACIYALGGASVAEPVSDTSAEGAATVRGVQITMMPDAQSQANIHAPQVVAPKTAADLPQADAEALKQASVTAEASAAREKSHAGAIIAGGAVDCVRAPGLTTDIVLEDDAAMFDAALSGLFRDEQAQVVVDLGAPTQLGVHPKPVQAWLGAVQDGGGVVEEAPLQCMKTRGLMSWMRRRISRIFTGHKPQSVYALAEDYNATLYYDESEELIRQIVFKRRDPDMLAQN